MQKTFTLLLLLFIGALTQAQDTRVVLIEQFTQASCPPCAPANERLQSLLSAYTEDEVVILRYQASFPGYDPMFEHNPGDVRNKQTYYGIRSVPSAIIDGTTGPGHPSNLVTKSALNTAKKKAPLCRIECNPTTSPDGENIQVHCKVTALKDFVGNEVAIIAIIEKHISFEKAPGGNGEKDFYNVMKKLLPSANGEELPKLKKDESYEFDVDWKFKNVYSIPEVAMIAFVQNSKSKAVYQALHIPKIIQSKYQVDGQISWISIDKDLDDNTTCYNYANPVVEIASRGRDLMTSAVIEYSVNGSTPQRYTWNGSLGFYDKTQVTLPEISFKLTNEDENTVEATIIEINGQEDDFADNNSTMNYFDLAPVTTKKLLVDLRSMTRPNRMSLYIINSAKEKVFEAGPFQRSEKSLKKEISLEDNECYEIVFNNTAPGKSNGRVTVKDDGGKVIFATRHIPHGETKVHFTTDPTIDSKDVRANTNSFTWTLTPNPAKTEVAIITNATQNMELNISIQDLLGKSIQQLHPKILKGKDKVAIDVSHLRKGIYLVTVKHGDAIPQTKKLLIRR